MAKKHNAFDALDSLARKYRHAVHSPVCKCKPCQKLLRGLIVAEDLYAHELQRPFKARVRAEAFREAASLLRQPHMPVGAQQSAAYVEAMANE